MLPRGAILELPKTPHLLDNHVRFFGMKQYPEVVKEFFLSHRKGMNIVGTKRRRPGGTCTWGVLHRCRYEGAIQMKAPLCFIRSLS